MIREEGLEMINNFGNNKSFAIEYELISNPNHENGILKESWGKFSVLIENKDICEYKIEDKIYKYEWNLINVVEWLCVYLEFIIGYDPFPLPIKADDVLSLIQVCDEFESSEDDEMYLWYQAKSLWLFRHSWFNNRDGSILSNVYFRRVQDEIEIAWDNSFFEEEGVSFIYPKGVYKVNKDEFKDIVFKFLNEILYCIESKLLDNMNNDIKHIKELQRKIRLIR
jgi:hypothetical protein